MKKCIEKLMISSNYSDLFKDRWHKLSLAEQMGNIGSEVHRAIKWRDRNAKGLFQSAFERAIELFDLTITDRRWWTGQSELTRAREVFCDLFFGGNSYQTDPKTFQAYFDQFAAAARK